ncbi:MAG: efflux RND transporter periplasmic adaptor subunit [Candidatus Kuenenia sp.]|nr:efflux RND transporter periplasmic adaptor subunit [Candidatus Kuenenia hertensis]
MRNRATRIITIIAIIAIVAALAVMKLGLLTTAHQDVKTQDTATKRLTVSAQKIAPSRLIEKIVVSGTVLPNEEVVLTSEITGKIEYIYFEEGSAVAKDDLLVKMNDEELQAQLQKVLNEKKLAEDNEERQRKLREKGIISQEEYDTVFTRVNSLLAEVDLIKARIEKTEIKAPFDGIIGLRYVSEGTYIYPEMRIANLVCIRPVKIDFAIPEKYGNVVKTGNKITFGVEGDEQRYVAEVYAIEPKIDPKTRTLQLRALYPNAKNEILPGSFAHIELTLREFENAIQIPTEALIPELGGQKVYVYKDGTALPVFVETGIRTKDTIQITDGLQPGDTLITSGILQIRPDMPIEITETY